MTALMLIVVFMLFVLHILGADWLGNAVTILFMVLGLEIIAKEIKGQ